MRYSWSRLSSSAVVTEAEIIDGRWITLRFSVHQAFFPKWPTIYAAFDPLLGLLMDKIEQAEASFARLVDEELFK